MDNVLFESEYNQFICEEQYIIDAYYTINFKVKSGDFSGSGSFCIKDDEIKNIIYSLQQMQQTLVGKRVIRDFDTDDFIQLSCEKLGHICVNGQLSGSHTENFIRFKYMADQTLLETLIVKLTYIINKQ